MSTLHQDLAALHDRYAELYQAASAGHIKPDDALATLAGMSVTDGTGAIWQINADGAFTRAQFNGAPAQVSDPSGYVGPETVTSNPEIGAFNMGPVGMTQAPTWQDAPSPQTPPAFAAPPAFGDVPQFGGDQFGAPTGPQHLGPAPAQVGGFYDPSTGMNSGPAGFEPSWVEPPARSLAAAEERHARGGMPRLIANQLPADGMAGAVRRNKVLAIIALVGLVLLGFAVFNHSRGTGDTIPPGNPGFGAPADPTATTGQDPSATLPADDPATALPTPNDAQKVLAALTSGDRATITSLTVKKPNADTLARTAAFFAGLDKTGLALTQGPAGPDGKDGHAAQQWTVTDGSKTVLTIDVTWTRTGNAWKLTTIPTP
jgi:hypothetical protein